MNPEATAEGTAGSTQQKLVNVAESLYRSAQSKVYYAIVYVGKRQIKRSLKTTDRKLAEHRLSEFKAKAGHLKPDKMAAADFDTIAHRWLAEHQHLLSRSTIRRKLDAVKVLSAIIGTKPIRSVNADDVERWKVQRGSVLASRSFNWELDIMRGVFGYAVKRGLLMDNPAKDTKRQPVKFRPVTIPTKDEFKALVAQLRQTHSDAHAADLVELLAYSGCRLQEATNLRWEDVDFDKRVIFVGLSKAESADDGIKTAAARRVIPMNTKLLELLARLEVGKPGPVVPIKSARKALQTACRKLWKEKDRFTHHDFRHMFATACIESGVDIPTVSRWLGHKDGGALCLKTYGHLRHDHSNEMASKVVF